MINNEFDPKKYPGTGTRMMREFLKKYSDTNNLSMESLPKDHIIKRKAFFNKVLQSIKKKSPVIVHQYWNTKGSRGHYRLVVGYNHDKEIVHLVDPRTGEI